MQKKNLNEVFDSIKKQHVRQFGTSNQTTTTLTEATIEARANQEEEKKDTESKGYGYRRAPKTEATDDATPQEENKDGAGVSAQQAATTEADGEAKNSNIGRTSPSDIRIFNREQLSEI